MGGGRTVTFHIGALPDFDIEDGLKYKLQIVMFDARGIQSGFHNIDDVAPNAELRETIVLDRNVNFVRITIFNKRTHRPVAESYAETSRKQKAVFCYFWFEARSSPYDLVPIPSKAWALRVDPSQSWVIPLDFNEMPYYLLEIAPGQYATDLWMSVDEGEAVIATIVEGQNHLVYKLLEAGEDYRINLTNPDGATLYVFVRPVDYEWPASGILSLVQHEYLTLTGVTRLVPSSDPDLVFAVDQQWGFLYYIQPSSKAIVAQYQLPWTTIAHVGYSSIDEQLFFIAESTDNPVLGVWDINWGTSSEFDLQLGQNNKIHEMVVAPSQRKVWILAGQWADLIIAYDIDYEYKMGVRLETGEFGERRLFLDEARGTLYAVSRRSNIYSYSITEDGVSLKEKRPVYFDPQSLTSDGRFWLVMSPGMYLYDVITHALKAEWQTKDFDPVQYSADGTRLYGLGDGISWDPRHRFVVFDIVQGKLICDLQSADHISAVCVTSDDAVALVYSAEASSLRFFNLLTAPSIIAPLKNGGFFQPHRFIKGTN